MSRCKPNVLRGSSVEMAHIVGPRYQTGQHEAAGAVLKCDRKGMGNAVNFVYACGYTGGRLLMAAVHRAR